MMGWIVYRERRLRRGLLLALPVVLGSVYTLPYIFIATFRSEGRFDALVLGDRRRHPAETEGRDSHGVCDGLGDAFGVEAVGVEEVCALPRCDELSRQAEGDELGA